ncbi:MAG: amidase [Proteobacteria bacterium]|nr:amidase [Pseudomonadota bacterium]MBI3496268.1 amidase [Pseudomonadota bacterium]
MQVDAEVSDFCAAATPQARALLAERQLARLEADEARVRAFVALDVDAARRQIALPQAGPLGGALVGLKDIIATADFPTRYGASETAPVGPRTDAWCVGEMRRLGATILGKTVCTQFAYPVPGPTTNPHDATRTPGGSSSGSAAAVAAGFVSFALGTQTAGSTIRPAAYCGITGFKPSFGLLHMEGVEAISTTLDHLGLFARSPRDVWYPASALTLPQGEVVAPLAPRRVLVLRLPPELPQRDGYRERLQELAGWLRGEGVVAETIDLPFPLGDFRGLQQELCYWEAARILLAPDRMQLVPELRQLLRPYLEKDIAEYAEARRRRQRYQLEFDALVRHADALIMPAATGVAPAFANTGDAVMNRFWTALHVPAITVPLCWTSAGLPLGLQLVGRIGADRALAQSAQWFYERRPVRKASASAGRSAASPARV